MLKFFVIDLKISSSVPGKKILYFQFGEIYGTKNSKTHFCIVVGSGSVIRDPGSGMEIVRSRDQRSEINIPDPQHWSSAALLRLPLISH
jgi:hypothetical protein